MTGNQPKKAVKWIKIPWRHTKKKHLFPLFKNIQQHPFTGTCSCKLTQKSLKIILNLWHFLKNVISVKHCFCKWLDMRSDNSSVSPYGCTGSAITAKLTGKRKVSTHGAGTQSCPCRSHCRRENGWFCSSCLDWCLQEKKRKKQVGILAVALP